MQKNNKAGGLKAKHNGTHFEMAIERACGYYKQMGIAHIQKTPEPMKQIATINARLGHFKAHYVKKAQPDFTGTLKGGKSVVFEAKNTDSTNLPFDRINKQQSLDLDYHEFLGARTFLLISFNLKRFYNVPWEDWKWMQENNGKKSVNEDELSEYHIVMHEGIIDFLQVYS